MNKIHSSSWRDNCLSMSKNLKRKSSCFCAFEIVQAFVRRTVKAEFSLETLMLCSLILGLMIQETNICEFQVRGILFGEMKFVSNEVTRGAWLMATAS